MSSFKIASLLFRTLSKPIANALKQQAKSHEIFRSLCINVAQVAHRTEMNWKMKVLGYKQEKIRPLNDARAIDAGANFLGEAFIFSVAVSLIFAEQIRSRNQARRRRDTVDDRLEDLEEQVSKYRQDIDQLEQERKLLRDEIDGLAGETATLSEMLMKVMDRGMKPPVRVDQKTVDQFLDGKDVSLTQSKR